MTGNTDLRAIERIILLSEGNVLRFIADQFRHLKEHHLTPLEQATADTAQRVQNLATEVQSANVKIDKLIALSLANGVPQADIDAITAIGAAADAATGALQSEEAKIDAATGTSGAPAEAASGSSSASEAAA